tara:strand:+ start:136 stop:474 length:339 start_codon:yes stop_codon:yes gene_type:complete
MPKIKLIISISIFAFLISITSAIKNQTRAIEKDLYKINKRIANLEKDLNETQLDFFYLSSPKILSKKLKNLDQADYAPMDFSRIYLSYNDFINFQNKISTLKKSNEKKTQKK